MYALWMLSSSQKLIQKFGPSAMTVGREDSDSDSGKCWAVRTICATVYVKSTAVLGSTVVNIAAVRPHSTKLKCISPVLT